LILVLAKKPLEKVRGVHFQSRHRLPSALFVCVSAPSTHYLPFHLGRLIPQIQKLANGKDGVLKLFSDSLELHFLPKISVGVPL
jgi:hypothetical protein